MNENELVQLVQAAMSGDSQAGQMLEQLMKSNPSIKGAVEQIIQGLQSETPAMKCGGRVKKKQLGEKIMKAKKASCGCQLKRVGGRLIEVDGCTGLPIHKNGAKIQQYWFGGNVIRGLGDAIGSIAGRVTEAGRAGWGHLQRGIGTAAQAVTGGERGNGFVRRGQEDIDQAAASGARVNSAVDNFSQKAGDAFDDVQRGVRNFIPGVGWALNAADSYMDEKVGNYDATTGNVVTSDGRVKSVVTPRYDDQKRASAEQLAMSTRPDETVAVAPGAEPITPVVPSTPQPVTGRYSKYGMQYTTDASGNAVEDWDNTQLSNKDIRRAAIADNRANYRDNRAQIRQSGMSLAQQEAMLSEQRKARRQANKEARQWSRAQQGAFDASRTSAITPGMASYNHNGGLLNYADYLK